MLDMIFAYAPAFLLGVLGMVALDFRWKPIQVIKPSLPFYAAVTAWAWWWQGSPPGRDEFDPILVTSLIVPFVGMVVTLVVMGGVRELRYRYRSR
jgi:hypothetical protein